MRMEANKATHQGIVIPFFHCMASSTGGRWLPSEKYILPLPSHLRVLANPTGMEMGDDGLLHIQPIVNCEAGAPPSLCDTVWRRIQDHKRLGPLSPNVLIKQSLSKTRRGHRLCG